MKNTVKGSTKRLIAYLIAGGAIAGCGALKKKASEGETEKSAEEIANEQIASGNVQMAGTLSLTKTTASLTSTAYSLYCVTFMEEPNSCKFEVTDGKPFKQDCEKFAGTAFGCFVRQGEKTISTIEFANGDKKDSSMIAGAGELKFDLKLDLETGTAYAKVDPKSPALSAEAMGGINEALSKLKTTVPNLTGTWKLEMQCEPGSNDGPCKKQKLTEDPTMSIYINHSKIGDKEYAAIWQSEAARKACVGDAGEGKPKFQVNGTAFDFSSEAKYQESVLKVYGALEQSLKDALNSEVGNRVEMQYGWCKNSNPYATLFSDENCKLVEASLEKNVIFQDGKEQVIYQPKWYGKDDFDAAVQYTGAVKAVDVACTREFKQGVAMCPPELPATATSFKSYVSASNNPVMLLCKDEVSGFFEQVPARGTTEGEAISAMQQNGMKIDDSCDKVVGGVFDGKLKAYAREMGRAVSEILSRASEQDDKQDNHMCGGTISDTFNFDVCQTASESQRPRLCWDLEWMKKDFGVKVEGGKLVASEEPARMFDHSFAEVACPNVQIPDGKEQFDHDQLAANCRSEFVGLTAIQQAKALQARSQQWMPTAEKIMCNDQAVFTKFKALAVKSCMPQIFNEEVCDKNGCVRALRCPGSSAGGKCFDKAGNFAGRIGGRHALMEIKPRIAGAFEMAEMNVDRWMRWDSENDKQVECRYIHKTIINARLEGEEGKQWEGIFNSARNEECEEGKDDSQQGSQQGKGVEMESFKMKATKQ